MFNIFNLNLRPFMDELDSGSGGVATSQETGSTESTTGSTTSTESTSTKTTSTESEGKVGGETDTQKSETESATQPNQTAEANHAFREMRLKAEAAERRASELETQRQRDIEVAKKYGQYGVYSDADVAEKYGKSHGLNTVAQFEEALRREEYQAKGIDPDMINKLIEDHPAIKQAKEYERVQAKERQDRFMVDSYNELTKEFADIKKPEDVPSDVWRLWRNGESGISLKQAYVAVNYESIATQKAEVAKQATLNNIQGKEHVRGNGNGTEGDTTKIPDEVLEMYKKFNPGKTMDEYKAHYKKGQK